MLLLVGYWIPAFVAIVVIDWLLRTKGRRSINPAAEHTDRADAVAAVIVFVVAYAAAIPFMNTSLIQGPVARAWHGADTAYFVNLARRRRALRRLAVRAVPQGAQRLSGRLLGCSASANPKPQGAFRRSGRA